MKTNILKFCTAKPYNKGYQQNGEFWLFTIPRPRRRWMNEIHDTTGMKLAELRDVSDDRKEKMEKAHHDGRLSSKN